MGLDEVLFGEGFVEQVLDGNVHVATVVRFDDFFCKLGEQRSWNAMKRQVN